MKIARKNFSAAILCSKGRDGIIISLHRFSVMKDNNKNGDGIQCGTL